VEIEVPKDKVILKECAQLMDMGKGGMISAKKDNLGINFSFNTEDKKGTLAVFSTQ